MARKYDPKTGTWKKVSDKKSSSKSKSKSNTSKKKNNDSSGKTNSSKTDKNSSAGSSKKKSNKKVLNTLEGTVTIVPTPTTIKIKPAQTIKITGVGSQLSGRYYVKDVSRALSSSGFAITLTVIKTNFRETLKTTTKTTSKKKGTSTSKTSRGSNSNTSSTKKNKRRHTVKKGETLYSIAKKYYKKGSKANINKIKKANKLKSDRIKVGQKLIIP